MNIVETKLSHAVKAAQAAAIAVHGAIRDAKSIGERESFNDLNTLGEQNLVDAQQALALYRAGNPVAVPAPQHTGVVTNAGDPMYASKNKDLQACVYKAVLAAKAANPGGSVNRVALNKAMGTRCASIRAELRF